MRLFSERESLVPRQEIADDAPEWLRNAFYNQALEPLLHLDRSSNPFESATDASESPIGVKSLIEKISIISRISTPKNYRMVSFPALETQLSELPWFHFYNSIELIGELLLRLDQENRYFPSQYFQRFRENTNKLFKEGAVGWRLGESGELKRQLPVEITELESSVASTNAGNPIANHIGKARGFINKHPCDAANCIKESVSALESFARMAEPQAKTLGEAIKIWRNSSKFPPQLLVSIEKLYAFASSEAGVRHGAATKERVSRADAEFVYVVAVALIRYLESTCN